MNDLRRRPTGAGRVRASALAVFLLGAAFSPCGCSSPDEDDLSKRASAGNADAMVRLAEIAHGRGRTWEEAALLKQAAKSGRNDAFHKLAAKAAQGSEAALTMLALYYEEVQKHTESRDVWYVTAKVHPGKATAITVADILWYSDAPGMRDRQRAVECLELAAEHEYPGVYALLVDLAADGLTGPVSEQTLEKWKRRAGGANQKQLRLAALTLKDTIVADWPGPLGDRWRTLAERATDDGNGGEQENMGR